MRYRYPSFALLLTLAGMIAVVGCGGGEETSSETPTAAIDNSSQTEDSVEGNAAAEPKIDPLHPQVKIETSLGAITLRLDKEKADMTVKNFFKYIDSKHYDNTIFHQVYRGQGIVGGGYTEDLKEKEDNSSGLYNEAFNGLKNRRGTVAMARRSDGIHSATCQFFINLADNPGLDHKDRTLEGYGYCVFGEVIEGMDVVDKIGACAVHDTDDIERTPVQAVLIKSVRRVQ